MRRAAPTNGIAMCQIGVAVEERRESLIGYQCAYGGAGNFVRCYPDSGREGGIGYFRGGTDPNLHLR